LMSYFLGIEVKQQHDGILEKFKMEFLKRST
jgi:hypothetical protein